MDKSKENELVQVARSMLSSKTHTIEDIRLMCTLIHNLDSSESEIFFPIIAIESETDQYPIGKVRDNYSKEYLQRMDIEIQGYLSGIRTDIEIACKEIIKAFS